MTMNEQSQPSVRYAVRYTRTRVDDAPASITDCTRFATASDAAAYAKQIRRYRHILDAQVITIDACSDSYLHA